MEIYPNPAQNEFTLIFEQGIPQNAVVRLIDFSGKVIHEEPLLRLHEPKILSTNHLDRGIYLVVVIGEGVQYKPKKVILN